MKVKRLIEDLETICRLNGCDMEDIEICVVDSDEYYYPCMTVSYDKSDIERPMITVKI